ncbi:uncharacterized protein LOC130429720 isoform X2 [Triplophysa dalaica]|uniref:uncharacterized protein LOC130429720 isoform X2 n=1 Tax=Triplophysa dalaica TaxID=1582913 RepID=UPI0024DFE2C8|nr:uncharacterized protein LOC130429720 isoform X2 [Triplophysa dalaica]
MKILLFFILLLKGVFGDPGEVKSVSVMEGENVTLNTHLTELRRDDLIVWTFGAQKSRIAQINQASNIICTDVQCEGADEGFRDRLKLDNQTGSLTITDIRTKHSGLYTIKNYRTEDLSKSFKVMVYAHLPIPVINRNSSQCSKCVLLCSVMNVTHVSLSWHKGNSLLSSTSESDLNIRLSLPLEVEYQDTNTYRCVINNPITNHTQHLDINDVCQPCSTGLSLGVIIAAIVCVVLCVCVVVGIGLYCWRTRQAKKKDTTDHGPGEESVPLKGTCIEKNGVKKVEVEEGRSVTLNTGETEIQGDEVVWWFGEAVNSTSSCVVITKLNAQGEEEECDNVDKRFKDKLQLDPQTGDLTITNIRTTDSGLYTLHISREKIKLFVVIVQEKSKIVTVTEGNSVTLPTDVFKFKRRDVIQWKFGDTWLAKVTRGCSKLEAHGIFKDSLSLDRQTGELTIKNIQTEHAGLYHLQIQSTQTMYKTFSVLVTPLTARALRSTTI